MIESFALWFFGPTTGPFLGGCLGFLLLCASVVFVGAAIIAVPIWLDTKKEGK